MGAPSKILFGAALSTLLGAFSCGEDRLNPLPSPAIARFELALDLPRFLDVPFPSDAYLEGDGTIVDHLPGLDVYAPAASATLEAPLGKMNGFGLITGAVFRVDRTARDAAGDPQAAAIDDASLPQAPVDCQSPKASVMLVDLDPEPGKQALLPCRAAYQDDRPSGSTTRPALAVLPARGVVLREGHRYVGVLTTSLTSDGGLPVSASRTFAEIRDGKKRDSALEKLYGGAVEDVLAHVPGLDRARIVVATPFTTQRVTQELTHLRALVTSLPTPALHWSSAEVAPMTPAVFTKDPTSVSTSTLSAWLGAPALLPDGTHDPAADQTTGLAYDSLLAVATGVFDAPNFLLERPEGYSNPEHRTFARGAGGEIVLDAAKPTSKIWVSIAIPNAPMPAGGFPVVVIQHGLGGDRSFLLTLANTFAKRGWASVSIEALTFGSRSAQPEFTVDQISRYPWSAGSGYSGPDGFVDKNANPLALFGQLVSFGATRDQFRQSAVDFGSLAKLLADPSLDLGPLATLRPGLKLDGSRIAYVGDSFGSVLGGLVAAIEPRYRAMVLNVGGGGILVELASNAPLLGSLIGPLGNITFGLHGDRLNWKHPLIAIVQAIIDGADPLSYTDAFVRHPVIVEPTGRPKSIVIIEALWDELVSNEGTEALAFAAGIPLAGPSTGPMSDVLLEDAAPIGGFVSGVPNAEHTVVIVQASPATHGSDLYSAHGTRTYSSPFVATETGFATLPMSVDIHEPYLELQAMVSDFIGSAFADGIPRVGGFPAPIRDFDGDGVPDASDGAPFDPTQR